MRLLFTASLADTPGAMKWLSLFMLVVVAVGVCSLPKEDERSENSTGGTG